MQDRYILITGCSSGIGKASAELFAANNWTVFATVRNPSDVNSLSKIGNPNIIPVMMDINDQASIETVFQTIKETVGNNGLAALVNNAAISYSFPLEYASNEHIRSHFETNVIGTLTVIRTFLPLLKKSNGRILNISSGAGIIATPLMGVYSASKYAIEALSDAFRPELRKAGIKVILLEPGFIDTEIHDKSNKHHENIKTQLDNDAWGYYGSALEKGMATNTALRKNAPKANDVAKVIFKAINTQKPKARYTAGKDARLLRIIAPLLTSRLRDKLWQSIFGL